MILAVSENQKTKEYEDDIKAILKCIDIVTKQIDLLIIFRLDGGGAMGPPP